MTACIGYLTRQQHKSIINDSASSTADKSLSYRPALYSANSRVHDNTVRCTHSELGVISDLNEDTAHISIQRNGRVSSFSLPLLASACKSHLNYNKTWFLNCFVRFLNLQTERYNVQFWTRGIDKRMQLMYEGYMTAYQRRDGGLLKQTMYLKSDKTNKEVFLLVYL